MKKFLGKYEDVISVENLLLAWEEFVKEKRSKKDVQEFQLHLMDNILALHAELANHTYMHGLYHTFNISDPKPRNIHKASVRDRLLHHTLHRALYPFFDRLFITDSYSCRNGKGTHKALNRFTSFGNRISKNHTKTCWALKCDIRKFFASIDHEVLINTLKKYIADERITNLLTNVIRSFETQRGKGLPLGNLTSQLFANVYMNEFDQFVKQTLKTKYYIRYADDFVFLSHKRAYLFEIQRCIAIFLTKQLKLSLHPDKVFLKTLASGVDFLGWVHFPDHRILRTATKRRMLKNTMRSDASENTILSYLGMTRWGNAQKVRDTVKRIRTPCRM